MEMTVEAANVLPRMKAENNQPFHFIEAFGANCVSVLAICCAAFCDLMPDFLYCPCLCCSDDVDDLSQNSIVDNCTPPRQTSKKSTLISQTEVKDSSVVTISPKKDQQSFTLSPQSFRVPVMPLSPSKILLLKPFSSTKTIITNSPYSTPPQVSSTNLSERQKKEIKKSLENRHIRLKRVLREPVLFSIESVIKGNRTRSHKRLKRFTHNLQ